MLTYAERLIAFRYLRARREEGLISVIAVFSLIGIALGVATLIVVLSVMRGVREEMIESIIGLEGHVTVSSTGRGIPDYDALSASIRNVDGVKSAIPIVQGQVMASGKGQAAGAMISGIRPEDIQYKPLLAKKITQGDLSAFTRGEGVVIGQRMAERMGLKVGDSITLISPEGRATPAGVVPRVKAYPIAALFSIGMFAYDNGLVVMPFREAQVFFKLSQPALEGEPEQLGMASAIEIIGTDADKADRLARAIAQNLTSDYRIYDWKSTNGHIFRAVIVQRNVMFMILTLIILVASFNIVSSLIMLVREKGRDIGILRTMGASRGMVQRIFIASGMSVGVVGCLSGVALGLLIALNTEAIQHWLERMTGQKLLADELYFLSSLPAKVDGWEVASVAAMALVLSFLASLYPARRASRLDPAEVLRYE